MEKFIIKDKDGIFYGPSPWNRTLISKALRERGKNISLQSAAPAGQISLAGITVENVGKPPNVDPRCEVVDFDGAAFKVREKDLIEVKKTSVRRLRAMTEADILGKVPQHKQRNASLGLLSAEEKQAVKDIISAGKAIYDEAEAAINAASTGAEAMAVLDSVVYPE